MMSPDPPREDSNREGEGNRDLSFNQVGFEDDDDGIVFVHDGTHELDISSQEDSEFGSDIDENDATRTIDDGEPLPHRTRAYYQLLIPFPASDPNSDINTDSLPQGDDSHSASSHSSSNVAQEEEKLDSQGNSNILQDASTTNEFPVQKREIQLTQDNVETIKNVMKGFALPAASIPPWAKEVDEDTWKKRLFDSIDPKTKST